MNPRTVLLLAALYVTGFGAAAEAWPQSPEPQVPTPPTAQPPAAGLAGTVVSEPAAPAAPATLALPAGDVWSMGQPSIYKWHVAALASSTRAIGVVGVGRAFVNPLTGILGWRLEGFAGAGSKGAEGGGRFLLTIPIAKVHIGVDYDARTNIFRRTMGFSLPIRRGGLFGGGSTLRWEWWVHDSQAIHVGLEVPIGQRAGYTRPRDEHARIPAAAAKARPDTRMADALRRFRAAADDVNTLVSPLQDRVDADPVKAVAADVAAVRRLGTPDQVLATLSRAWQDVFTRALQTAGGTATPEAATAVALLARHTVLDEVLLPYDALIGRRRSPDTLRAFTRQAREAFSRALPGVAPLDERVRAAASDALAAVIDELDAVRSRVRGATGDGRKVFLPLQLALEPHEHDTQAEIDALVERATRARFSDGNRVRYVADEAFHLEFEGALRRAKRFHVLWIHDYRGKADLAEVDLAGLGQTVAYLRVLAERVREFDAARSLPEYYLVFDEFYYQSNKARQWISLLEHPLRADASLPKEFAAQEQELRQAQQALRDAVAASRGLQEGRAKFGDGWLERVVRVHVNITNPEDWSFWHSDAFPIWGLPDNWLRDHRKMVFYDLSEEDPYAGEAMFTGMGIGEKYVGAHWEDRGLIVQGPAALRAKAALREVFRQQGARADQIPAVFRERPFGADYAARVEAETRRAAAEGGVPPARALQLHDEVGFGLKEVSVANLLLFSLLPPRSVVVAPDSAWESHLYASLLAGSALRGCRVLIVTPAWANSPLARQMVRARANILAKRLLVFSQALGNRITERGGLLKIGLYNETTAGRSVLDRVRAIRAGWDAAGPWLKELVPISDAVLDQWQLRAAELAQASPPASPGPPPAAGTRPKLHVKGVLIASAEGWGAWFSSSQVDGELAEYLRQQSPAAGDGDGGMRARTPPGASGPQAGGASADDDAGQTPEERGRRLYYLQIGSANMNNRSLVGDGESSLIVSGPAAHVGLIDFLAISGLSTWVETVQQIDELIPPPGTYYRLMSHLLQNIV